MTRTIENIVQCHKDASELRKQGKPIWNRTLKIKHLLSDDESDETIVKISNEIAKIIILSVPSNMIDEDYDFLDTIESMEQYTIEELILDKDNGYESVDIFNGWLDAIYDWADYNRIWIE